MALVVTGGRAFHGDPPSEKRGDLLIAGAHFSDAVRAPEVLNAEGCLVLPGLVNAHHHLYSSLARGMPGPSSPPDGFVELLEKIWWRLDRALDGPLVALSAKTGMAESLRSGVTGVVDHHASPNVIEGSLGLLADATRQVGGRAVLCYEATERHGEDGFAAGLAENQRFAQACAEGSEPLLRAMVGGHAPFTLSDGQLKALAELAQAEGVAVHMHLAEDAHDQADARRRGAEEVLARVEAAGMLESPALMAHGVHLSEPELDNLAASGAWLSHQPRSNMNNGVGYLEAARSYGPRLTLGTDGINGDLFAEAQSAFFRLREHDGGALADTIWGWLAGGWRLMSQAFDLAPGKGFGWLHPGCPADFVVLDYDAPAPVTAANLPWHLAFGISSRHVRDVVVAGKIVVRDRRLLSLDEGALREEAAEGAARLWARMDELG